MSRIDDVISAIPTMTETKREIWAANAARVIARGPRRNPAHADAQRLQDAIEAFEATRPQHEDLTFACGLEWDRAIKDRNIFRGFDGDRLVARITRVKPGKFAVKVKGTVVGRTYSTLSAARAAAADAVRAGEYDPLTYFRWAA
ncbi:hypothetical protein [Roseicyclus marinus]|uniref:hypothetical protein n=1 Tax=Roseicyclus marinus TaxID=2161673 RepID=UPI0024104A31|nr:hypothetical protein [Roseicyclus marinus]MDG3039814.1 hypothetical protein [Roseicyclus marinus]